MNITWPKAVYKTIFFLLILILLVLPHTVSAFDHEHLLFDSLLEKHVILFENGRKSMVNYSALKKTGTY